jgi:hypothetical protein
MGAVFSWRKTRAGDLPACLKLHPAKNGAETVGLALALKAWHELLCATDATRSAVVELRSNGHVEVVGFGLATFVKKPFADAELQHPRPGLNARLVESLINGHSVVATYDEVRRANTQGDLQQVILDTSWNDTLLNSDQRDAVRVLLGRAYQELYAGYHFGRILAEMVDTLDLWHVRGHRSFEVVDRFDDFRQANPDTMWNADRALLAATSDTMRLDPHSVAAELFQHHRQPRFAFTRREQQLLEIALEGGDDASASDSLSVTVPAIKRRWERIFDRVAAVTPEICPPAGDGRRGVQKRQRILTYVRQHPEELRPFDFGQRATVRRE